MHLDDTQLRLAATDVSNHLACRHLTRLDREVAAGRLTAPSFRDPGLALLQERGLAHERAFIEHLRASGLRVIEPAGEAGRLPVQETVEAMHSGAEAIVQAELRSGRWFGRADILLRVPEPSDLGTWSYEALDTKLAEQTRAGAVLQLCLYGELVAAVQGRVPALMHVVKPGPGFPRESFRTEEYAAYYRLVRRRLEEFLDSPPQTYPDPVPHCEVCRWWRHCDARRHADDSLSLVAGIRPLHVGELERQGVHTLTQFAEQSVPLRTRPERGNPEAFARAHGQAQVQLLGRRAGRPRYRLLAPEPGQGFFELPEPDAGDVFFDIESDQFAGEGGVEYLLGVAFAGTETRSRYQAFWALEQGGERRALERFVDLVMGRWRSHPGMHVYHFSPYEPAAVKRLIGRYGTREAEVDSLLRARRFVDLFAVTRHGLQASVESYSLKALEPLYGFTRTLELPAAGAALRRIARALELTGAAQITAEERAAVEAYNRDDCLSTAALRDWLEERRAELVGQGHPVPRPESRSGEASEAVEERAAEVQALFEQLTAGLPEERSTWGAAERGRWLLAHQLEYFRREDKSAWWEYFRIQDLDYEELLEERKAIAGLRFVASVAGGSRSPTHRYSFPPQEAAMQAGDPLHEIGGGAIGRVQAIDLVRGTLEITKSGKALAIHPAAVMVSERVPPAPVDRALLELARALAPLGAQESGPFPAARDLLLAARPRLRPAVEGPLRRSGEDVVQAAIRLARSLDSSILPIQGPPGSGKTYTGARMIAALAREGHRIGVTAVSHKVIRNLLRQARCAAEEAGISLPVTHKVSRPDDEEGVEQTTDNAAARERIVPGAVVGGTAWFWAREEMLQAVDYLFVDEAGQMSLAHALATARAAGNLVLLGDPQQLEQPQRGAHPEGAEVAALVHLLHGRRTISEEAGLFLDETWRLAPSICAFTSELFYEGRLRSRAGLENQVLDGTTPFAGSGLFYVPVQHTGNQNSCPEEAEAVRRIVTGLLDSGASWTSSGGSVARLEASDILVVAPYNAQVAAITARLPAGVRVGTVDRFQGQQAPVVVYSMTSSSAEDAPRGLVFLFNPNRLNVATSRARCACILVAARRLLEPECQSPEQMRWANCLCRYRELATEVVI